MKRSRILTDGILYLLIALFGAGIASFTSDEASIYVNGELRFWLTEIFKWGLALVTALKIFRSTAFAEYQVEKAKVEEEKKRLAVERKSIT